MGAQNVDGRPEACQIWKLQGHFFQTDQANFFRRFVTQDKTWVHLFEPEPKLLSKQRE
jgi:hypothetical protein